MSRIDRAEVLRYLGHRGQPMSPALAGELRRAMALCAEVARPRHLWAEAEDPALRLPLAVRTAAMAVTLGHGLAREIDAQQHRDMAFATMLDAAATALTESEADVAEAEISAWAAGEGLFPCPRVSPGYGELPLALHGPILRALNAERRLGLTATERWILTPQKSVTALVALRAAPVGGGRGCERCAARGSCPYRR